MTLETIRLERSDHVATLFLNRPDNLNALNLRMLNELAGTLDELAVDDEIHAVIITGEGKAFSAGADVRSPADLLALPKARKETEDILKLVLRVTLAIRQMPKPAIAALNGVAAGASANFALACDLVIASENARLAENFINIGLVPDGGGTFFLLDRIGYQRSCEIFFTGKILSSQEAFDLGLINRVVPPEEVLQEARKLAQDLIQKPRLAIAAGKAILNREVIPRLRAYLEDEVNYQRLMLASYDAREGIAAFTEKRKPQFLGK